MSWYQSEFRQALSGIILLKIYGVLVNKQTLTTEKLRNAERNIDNQLKLFDRLLSKRTYAAGENLTIADLLLFFELTNLMLYKKSWSEHTNVDAWFKRVYAVSEVKSLTHAWFPASKQTIQLLDSIQPTDAKL